MMWTRKNVADFLNVSIIQVDNLRLHYGLPFMKLGGSVRFYPEEVTAWLNSKREVRVTRPDNEFIEKIVK